MTCKDCIHYDVCKYHITEEASMTVAECGSFKNKADFVEYHHIEQTVKDFWSGLKQLSAFKNLQEPTLTELLEYIEQTNAETVKEFAERVQKIITIKGRQKDYFNDLVNEMVGKDDAK